VARLSLKQLDDYDPRAPYWHARERRFACPTDECSDKRVDAAHRSLSANMDTGAWYCHRCGQGGVLSEYVKKGDPWKVVSDEEMDAVWTAITDQIRLRDEALANDNGLEDQGA
jgi:hypothetical protein